MMFWLRFALRSVLRRRRRTLITFISVGLGIAMLIILGAIMVGVNDTMIENAVSLHSGHILLETPPQPFDEAFETLQKWDRRADIPGITDRLPRLTLAGVLKHQKQVQAIQLFIVDAQREELRSPIAKKMQTGEWLETEKSFVIGSGTARALNIEIGQSVSLVTAEDQFQLQISGVFHTGVQVLDQGTGYIPLAMAKELDISSPLEQKTALFALPGEDLDQLARQLRSKAGSGDRISTWQDQLPEVEQLVDLNEFSMQIMILLVIAILAFGVANSLLISVMDRYRYYGILKAIGARPTEVVTTVIGEAMLICLSASLIGTVIGILISLIWGSVGLDLSHYTSYNPHFSINPVIHPRLEPVMVFLPQGLALIGGIIASIWPALVAARRNTSSNMRDL